MSVLINIKAATFIVLLIWMVSGPVLNAAEYIVKQDGSGDYTTIQAAANIAMPGDTVTVHEGIYYEWVQPKHSGTASQPITYRVNAGDDVWIDGQNTRRSCFGPNPGTGRNQPSNDFGAIHYIILDGFGLRNSRGKYWTVENGRDGDIKDAYTISAVSCAGGRHWVIQNCDIGPNLAGAIECGSNIVRPNSIPKAQNFGGHSIRNNYIHNNNASIYGFTSHFTRVTGNRFENNKGVSFEGSHVKFLRSYGVVVEGNIFSGGSQWEDIWFDNSNQACRISGNVFADPTGRAIYLEANNGPFYIDHNIFLFDDTNSSLRAARGIGATVVTNNLFVNSSAVGFPNNAATRDAYVPITAEFIGQVTTTPDQSQNVNNLYMNPDLSQAGTAAKIIGDDRFSQHNLVYDAAAGSVSDPGTQVFSTYTPHVQQEVAGDVLLLDVTVNSAINQPESVIVDNSMVWPSGSMEVIDEVCPTFDTDFTGQTWTAQTIKPGPFANLQAGNNQYVFVFGPRRSQGLPLRTPDNVANPGQGVAVQKYDGVFNSFDEVLAASPSSEYTDTNWNLSQRAAFIMDGYFRAEENGVYVFYLSDRRDYQLWIGDELLLTHPEPGKPRVAKAAIALRAGMHRYRLLSRQTQRLDQDVDFQASYRHQSTNQQSIPNNLLHIGSTVPNAAPVITAVTPDPNPVVGMTSTLTAVATDDDDDPLTYTWSTTAKPVGAPDPSFSENGSLSAVTTVTFAQAGAYAFAVSVTDGRGGSASNSVAVTVSQTASGLEVE